MHKNIRILFAVVFALMAGALNLQAQWLTQNHVLKPGWNAVYLFVDASGQTLDTLVGYNGGCPIDQVWQWKTLPGTAQYLSTPASPLMGGSQWLTYYRPGTGISTLAALSPNAAYLVHSSAATNYIWSVQGVPAPPNYLWDNTGLNLIGFSTPDVNPPTFQNLLAPAPAFASAAQVYQYLGGNFGPLNPAPVFSTYTTPVTRGQAFWVSAANINNAYYGPFTLTLPNSSGLNFSSAIGQFTMQLLNVTSNALTITATLVPSETPPAGQAAIVDAPPLLVEGALNAANLTYSYTALAAGGTFTWTLAPAGQPGSQVSVTLGVNRFALTAPAGSLYAGILRFTDSLGLAQVNVPVSATAANNAGLWVGSASVSQVGQYLKTYATNADGSYRFAVATNTAYATNAAVLLATNLTVYSNLVTTTTVDRYTVTNQVVNTYTTNALTVTTNAFVVGTNVAYAIYQYTNTVITTTPVGYDWMSAQWQTAKTTNTLAATSVTNTSLSVVSVAMAPSLTNNTPVRFTNSVTSLTWTTNVLTTNGLFLDPVTTTWGYGPVSNTLPSVVSTNLVCVVTDTSFMGGTGSTTNWVTFTYSATNLLSTAQATTNFYRAGKPFYVVTNGASWLVFYLVTNYLTATNVSVVAYDTNVFSITNSFLVINGQSLLTGSVTNPLSDVRVLGPSTAVGSVIGTNLGYAFNTVPSTVVTPVYTVVTNASYAVTGLNTNLGAVPTPYPLRLIVFNDGVNCSLLSRVYVGLRQQTNLVVATTESVLDTATLNVARRISSTIMPYTADNAPVPLSGTLAQGGVLTATITEAYDNQASNPYLHTYHPDHNNLNYATTPPTELPVGSQSYDISQTLSLLVVPNNEDFLSLTTGNTRLSGQYTEVITLTGLGGATRTFNTAGTFSLTRISSISTLTTPSSGISGPPGSGVISF